MDVLKAGGVDYDTFHSMLGGKMVRGREPDDSGIDFSDTRLIRGRKRRKHAPTDSSPVVIP